MKYQHKKNGKIVTLLEVREKFKTVMVQPESMDDNDGLPYDITTSTFKRWWKKIEDDVEVEQTDTTEEVTDDAYVDEVMKQKEELGIDVPELNPDDVEVVTIDDVAINAPIMCAKNWLVENDVKFKTSRDGIRVFEDDGKTRIMEIWKRKRCVRIYINASDGFDALNKTLIQRETKTVGQVAKRYDTSFYVPAENIDAVFRTLICK